MRTGRGPLGRGDVRVCDYVDLPLEDLVARLSGPPGEELLRAALASSVGSDPGGTNVRVGGVMRFGGRVASADLAWQVAGAGAARSGEATLTAVAVQTGRHARTELLVTLDSTGHPRDLVLEATRGFLDSVTSQVATAPAH